MKKIILCILIGILAGCGDKPHSEAYYKDNISVAISTLETSCNNLNGDDSVAAENCRKAKGAVMSVAFFCPKEPQGDSHKMQNCRLIKQHAKNIKF